MRIENIGKETNGENARVAATVIWENCDRPTQQVYYATSAEFAEDLGCSPHAFLVGCLMPAMRHGEQRIAIDEEICPELRNGLETAMGWMRHWYDLPRKPIRIEARKWTRPQRPPIPERAGAFLSGGVDSLAMLRANRLDFPLEHPRSIRDCILVHGFDMGATAEGDWEQGMFDRALHVLSRVAEDAGVTLIPLATNIRHLDSDVAFWIYEFFGAALASVAHVFSCRLTTVSIASGLDIPNYRPVGSHPLLDPNYGCAALHIRHEDTKLSRLDKVRLLADWDVALQSLRVCTMNPVGVLNCGTCEKCIRTMVELLSVGKLASAPTFPASDVSADLLRTINFEARYEVGWYQELVEPLTAMGRHDLVEVIQAKTRQFDKRMAWQEERDWKGMVKRFDRKHLDSSLFEFYRTARARITGRSHADRA